MRVVNCLLPETLYTLSLHIYIYLRNTWLSWLFKDGEKFFFNILHVQFIFCVLIIEIVYSINYFVKIISVKNLLKINGNKWKDGL